MDKNAKFTIAAVAFLGISSIAVFTFTKVGADENQTGSPIVQTENKTESFPLKTESWNNIAVPWNVSALKNINIVKDDEKISVEAASETGIIESGILLSDDGDRVLGMKNELLSGQTIKVFVNKTEAKKLTIIFER